MRPGGSRGIAIPAAPEYPNLQLPRTKYPRIQRSIFNTQLHYNALSRLPTLRIVHVSYQHSLELFPFPTLFY